MQTLTVLPAVMTVTAQNASRSFGQPNPIFTDGIMGFVLSNTASSVAGSLALTTTATTTSPAGTYPVVTALGTLTASNYAFNFVNGTLTVIPLTPQTVTFGAIADATYGVGPITLAATANGSIHGDRTCKSGWFHPRNNRCGSCDRYSKSAGERDLRRGDRGLAQLHARSCGAYRAPRAGSL